MIFVHYCAVFEQHGDTITHGGPITIILVKMLLWLRCDAISNYGFIINLLLSPGALPDPTKWGGHYGVGYGEGCPLPCRG